MEIIAKSTFVRLSPRKLRLVAQLVRGRRTDEAENILKNLDKAAAKPLLEVLKQGVGNSVNNFKQSKDSLRIKSLEIGEGPRLKRIRFVSRGRVHQVLKRTGNIKMVIESTAKPAAPKKEAKPNGTKS